MLPAVALLIGHIAATPAMFTGSIPAAPGKICKKTVAPMAVQAIPAIYLLAAHALDGLMATAVLEDALPLKCSKQEHALQVDAALLPGAFLIRRVGGGMAVLLQPYAD